MTNSPIEFKTTQSQVVTSTAVFTDLDNSEKSKALRSNFIVNRLVNSPSAGGTFLLQGFLLFYHFQVIVKIVR